MVIFTILCVPMYIYATIMISLEEAKTQQELTKVSQTIITQMDSFDPSVQEIFYFPRFKTYQAGLYSTRQEAIFSTIKNPIDFSLQEHYVDKNGYRYLITPLPQGVYFGANFLVIQKEFSLSALWVRLFVTALAILLIIYIISYLLVREFEKPLKALNARLDTFIKDSVHEINTPLAIIYANVELSEDKQGKSLYLSRIYAAAKTLSTIYNDMEYLIKKNRISKTKKMINLGEFVQDRIDYFSDIASMKKIVFHSDLADHITLLFNETQLTRIVDNTLSNAIKYSHDSTSIEVIVTSNGGQSIFEVKDFGIGIEKPEAIFERFYREDEAKGGFGIGLSIVKSICDEHNVSINITSKLNEGTTFHYIFPHLI